MTPAPLPAPCSCGRLAALRAAASPTFAVPPYTLLLFACVGLCASLPDPASYIVMTYCESGDLSAAIKEQRRKGALAAACVGRRM